MGVVEEVDAQGAAHHLQMPFFSYLAQLMDQYRLPASSSSSSESGGQPYEALPFNFWGGPVGYLGYELKAECGGAAAHAASQAPDAALLLADRLVAVDHLHGDIYALAVYQPLQGEGQPGRCLQVPWSPGDAVQEAVDGSCTGDADSSCPGQQGSQAWVQHTLSVIAALSSKPHTTSLVQHQTGQPSTSESMPQSNSSDSSRVFSLCHSKDMYIANIKGCKR